MVFWSCSRGMGQMEAAPAQETWQTKLQAETGEDVHGCDCGGLDRRDEIPSKEPLSRDSGLAQFGGRKTGVRHSPFAMQLQWFLCLRQGHADTQIVTFKCSSSVGKTAAHWISEWSKAFLDFQCVPTAIPKEPLLFRWPLGVILLSLSQRHRPEMPETGAPGTRVLLADGATEPPTPR